MYSYVGRIIPCLPCTGCQRARKHEKTKTLRLGCVGLDLYQCACGGTYVCLPTKSDPPVRINNKNVFIVSNMIKGMCIYKLLGLLNRNLKEETHIQLHVKFVPGKHGIQCKQRSTQGTLEA